MSIRRKALHQNIKFRRLRKIGEPSISKFNSETGGLKVKGSQIKLLNYPIIVLLILLHNFSNYDDGHVI